MKHMTLKSSNLALLMTLIALLSVAVSVWLGFRENIIFILSPAFVFVALLLFPKAPSNTFMAYMSMAYWLVIVFFSIASAGFGSLFQLSIFVFLPFSFLLVGYFSNLATLYRALVFCSILVVAFSILERAAYFSLFDFEIISDFSGRLRSFRQESEEVILFSRATGLFENPNSLGLFCASAIFLLMYLRSPSANDFLYAGVLGALYLCLFLSLSRGSIVAVGLGLLTFLIFSLRSNRIFWAVGGAFLFVCLSILVMYIFFSDYFALMLERSSVFDSEAGGRNFVARQEFWHSFFMSDYIAFGTIASPESVLGHAIDNMFIRAWAQGGLIGFLLTIGLFLETLGFIMRQRIAAKQVFALAFVLVFFLNSNTTLGFQSSAGIVQFWLFYGIIARASAKNDA